MPKKIIGVHGTSALSFIDHLVPLCQILDIPLFCVDPWVYEMVELYYPPMQLYHEKPQDYCLDPYLKDYDAVAFVVHYKKCHGGYLIGDYLLQSNAKSIYSLHGNSDKKRNLFWAEKCADEDIVLLYGEFMRDFVKEKGIYDRIPHVIMCGNYRLEFYKSQKNFFQKQLKPVLFPKNGKMTILYAPTWTSPNRKVEWRVDYTSFFENSSFVLDTIPKDFQIYVKMHPYLLQLYPEQCAQIKEHYAERQQIRFIDDLPLIYPLLEHCDIYLGDYSSIGYDFLFFDRPLFFLNADQRDYTKDTGVYLYRCGVPIAPSDFPKLYSVIDKHLKEDKKCFPTIRQETYNYAYSDKSLEILKEEIYAAL